MSRATEFMQDFMEKLENNEFHKDNLPNHGVEFTKEYAREQRESYRELLDSELFEEVCKW